MAPPPDGGDEHHGCGADVAHELGVVACATGHPGVAEAQPAGLRLHEAHHARVEPHRLGVSGLPEAPWQAVVPRHLPTAGPCPPYALPAPLSRGSQAKTEVGRPQEGVPPKLQGRRPSVVRLPLVAPMPPSDPLDPLHHPYLEPSAVKNGPLLHVELQVAADRKSTRLNSSHGYTSYAVFC